MAPRTEAKGGPPSTPPKATHLFPSNEAYRSPGSDKAAVEGTSLKLLGAMKMGRVHHLLSKHSDHQDQGDHPKRPQGEPCKKSIQVHLGQER